MSAARASWLLGETERVEVHSGARGDGQAGSQVRGSLSCPAGGLRSPQQDARKDRRDGAPFPLRKNNGHSSTGG